MGTSDRNALVRFVTALADDELVLGHRDAEWTGHAPILEEDIAFSNIAQDELGHSLVWFTLLQGMTGSTPDAMAFERPWQQFTCCRFTAYPRGDFAYTVMRQYLFDEAEQVRLGALVTSSHAPLRDVAAKLLREESYHLMHSRGLVERLGGATEESHRRMQAAADAAFPQALGLFEELEGERSLVAEGVFPGNNALQREWLRRVVPVLRGATLAVPVRGSGSDMAADCPADLGGRRGAHHESLRTLVEDLQAVWKTAPGAAW
jgi:ring-1,2-phenylacetyl-CoA epoxidase subunit PaaC